MHLLQPELHTRRAFLRRSTQLGLAGTALPFAPNLAAMGEAAADSMNPALAGLTSLLGSATAAAPTWYSMRKAGG